MTYKATIDPITELKLNHRYLFVELKIDRTISYEAVVEEVSPSGKWTKLRQPSGMGEWIPTESAVQDASEELPERRVYE
jgi:hypothetical protein